MGFPSRSTSLQTFTAAGALLKLTGVSNHLRVGWGGRWRLAISLTKNNVRKETVTGYEYECVMHTKAKHNYFCFK